MKLEFIEDINRDVKNWQSSLTAHSSFVLDPKKYLPKDIAQEKLDNTEYLKQYLSKKFYEPGKISEFKNWLTINVNTTEIQNDIETLMDKAFSPLNIKAYITVFGLGRYSPELSIFYIIYSSPEQDRRIRISNIYHELMHFLFHFYYWDKCKKAGLSETQIHDLKESLTVLLNPILKQRELPLDSGYPSHQILRANLKKLWSEGENFEVFLKKALSVYSNIQ